MNFYFTFGCGSPLAKYVVIINAEDEHQARCRMICLFSRHWSSVYGEVEGQQVMYEHGLTALDYNKEAGLTLMTSPEQPPLDIFNRAYPWVRQKELT